MYKMPDAPICERGNDLVSFLYGELDERTAQDFSSHLFGCAECESELGAFQQIRSSVGAWRQESLGGVTTTATPLAASPALGRMSDSGQRSASAAIRGFFELSPLWMKSSLAFASLLFCVVSIVALLHLFENPKPAVLGDEKRYTEKELQAKIDDALKLELQERETQKLALLPPAANNRRPGKPERATNRSNERVALSPKAGRGPLTKSEREQLAADLRLTLSQDDTDLDLLSDRINR